MEARSRRENLLRRIAAGVGLTVSVGLGILANAGHTYLAAGLAIALIVFGMLYLRGRSSPRF
jgi:hypothetical protein